MSSVRIITILSISLSALPTTSLAKANHQKVVLRLYENPSDPLSDVLFTLRLELTEKDLHGNSIGWEVLSVNIRQHAKNGQPERKWSEFSPVVDTSDGLWWTEHADVNAPVLSEFSEPPLIWGTAAADDPNDADLDYNLKGGIYVPPGGTSHFPTTAALNYNMTEIGAQQSMAEGEEEPAELDDNDQEELRPAKQKGQTNQAKGQERTSNELA